ncbi:MAG: hypothetical protein ACPGWM_07995, partial [Flavobacteriales bacterium]
NFTQKSNVLSLSKKELSFFYPTFESKIKKIGDKYPSLREVSEAWQTTLYEVAIKSDSVKLHYDALSHSEKQNINNISDTLNTIASLDTIKAAFIASKKPSVKSQKLAKGENLNLTIELENGTILNHTIQTQIVKIDDRACAVPTDISLAASNKDGYTFEQKNLLASQDFVAPPEGYFLLGAGFSGEIKVKQHSITVSLRGENILNERFRDYLNRQRYFADGQGLNLIAGIQFAI